MNESIINIIDKYPFLFWVLTTWGIVWKGLALWKSATKNSKTWFIGILIINSMGLLEIAYIFFLNKYNPDGYIEKGKNLLFSSLKKGKIKQD